MCDRLYLIDRAIVKAGAEITSPTREALIKRVLIALFAGGDGNGKAGKGIGSAEDGEKYSTIASIHVEMAICFTKKLQHSINRGPLICVNANSHSKSILEK
jgi:hypothetical protein